MNSIRFALEALDRLIQAKEDTAIVKGKKIKFTDPTRRKAGKSAWAKTIGNRKWLKDHPDSPIAPVVRQYLANKRKGKHSKR